MPVVRELFGQLLDTCDTESDEIRRARCPYMGGLLCDGGGNRDMTRWPASDQPLAPFFDSHVGKEGGGFIPCGVCSIEMESRSWAVCPRRLLNFDRAITSGLQHSLRERIFQLAGFSAGDVVRVWSEITLRDQKSLNYRLDYVLRKNRLPPIILEVMTASTSGGNKSKRTDMQSAFCDAVLYANGILKERNQSPGVNVRQVWARMASQLVVKSEIANHWGGLAIWVVQDELMNYIRLHTGLKLDELRSPNWEPGEINMIAANLDNPDEMILYAGPIHSHDGKAC